MVLPLVASRMLAPACAVTVPPPATLSPPLSFPPSELKVSAPELTTVKPAAVPP